VVHLTPETRRANARFFGSIDEVPEWAMTMGVGAILKAKMIMLIAKGAEMAEMVQRAQRPDHHRMSGFPAANPSPAHRAAGSRCRG